MKRQQRLIIILIGWFLYSSILPVPSFGQIPMVDSLQALLTTSTVDTQRMNVLLKLGQELKYRDPNRGIEYNEEVLGWAKQEKDTSRLIAALDGIGNCHYYMGELEQAGLYWAQVLEWQKYQKDSIGLGNIYNNFGMLCETQGVLDSAAYYYEQALRLYNQHGTPFHGGMVYNNLGLVFQKQGFYPRAISSFLEALSRFEAAAKPRAVSVAMNNLGMVHNQQHSYEEAIVFYRRALDIKKGINDIHGMSTAYNNIGAVFTELNELDSAILYHQQSLNLKRQMGDEMGVGISLNNLGSAYEKQGHLERAKDLQIQAYQKAEQSNSQSDLARASVDLGRVYLKLKQFDQAQRYLELSLVFSREVGERENQLKVYNGLYQLFKGRDNAKSLKYYEAYSALNDSLRNDKELKEITRLEMQYEFDKEKKILALEKERSESLLEAKLERQKIVRNASTGGFLAGLVLIGILWRGFQQKRKNNRLLKAQKNTIQEALEDRETLLKEIHHRVKNNLQVVSSLLSLQSRSITDPIALGAIKEGRNRVKAMALIHQNLYQEENLVGVDLPDYIQKLSDSLLHSYKVDDHAIQINHKIAPITIDADTLIPLALILNELISNALKYAFKGSAGGTIDIEIDQLADGLKIVVKDTGTGLPPGFQLEQAPSLGFKLIRSFVAKMKAQLEVFSNEGTRISILLPDFR